MNLLDFIGRAVREIEEKQTQALEEFSDGIINLEISENYNRDTVRREVA